MKEPEELSYDVDLMTCVVDKSDGTKIVDFDSHFSDFTGVHPSKLKQGKLHLMDILQPIDRETIFRKLRKKDFRFNYFEIEILDKDKFPVLVHCIADNIEGTNLCQITFADISKSEAKQKKLKQKTREMNALVDMVSGGVCLFKVSNDMHIEAIYLNKGCCKLFGTTREDYSEHEYRIDDLIYKDDKTKVFQAIGSAMATNEEIDLEIRVQTHKNEFSWVKFNAAIRNYDSKKNPVFASTFTDISRVKEAEEKADKESEKLVNIFKNLPGNVFCTTSGDYLKMDYVSEDLVNLLGYSRAELFEINDGLIPKIMAENNVDKIRLSIEECIKNNEEINIKYNVKTKRGKTLTLMDTRKVIKSSDGGISTVAKYTVV